MSETYTVVLLVEQALQRPTPRRCARCTRVSTSEVRYHVLLPAEDAAARVEAAMGALGTDTLTGAPAPPADPQTEAARPRGERAGVLARPRTRPSRRCTTPGPRRRERSSTSDPIDALAATVSAVDGREAIILTRPHVVSEFFHLDWSSRARRKIGVPVLHLLEHENFDEQAGAGEGVTGL